MVFEKEYKEELLGKCYLADTRLPFKKILGEIDQ